MTVWPVFPRRRHAIAAGAVLFSLAAAVAFVITAPPVGDLWAARAREYAALHGVGLNYWFSWFDGTVPGNYSVLAPYLAHVANVSVLGAVATAASVVLCRPLLRGSRHPVLALWAAAIASAFSLWSGRVPFAVGTTLALCSFLAVRANRRVPATAAAIASVLASPVSGAFLVLGFGGIWLHDRERRRVTLTAGIGCGLCLIGLAGYFGMPGPEGFPLWQATMTAVALVAMLLARPAPYVRSVLLVSLLAFPFLAFVPNGMGSNFERFAWIWLPVAALATARARLPMSLVAVGVAICSGIVGSANDLAVAAQPMSAPAYYDGLAAELDRLPNLADYRVEVVPDGTHVAAYELLGHAMLARGYETQSDNALNAILSSPKLDAVTFKLWLDNNAVGYVALDKMTLKHGPEDTLVRTGRLPYLSLAWSDAHWLLYRVGIPTPVATPPARVVDADAANLVVHSPARMTIALRIRWSRFLRVTGGAVLRPDGGGWTTLRVPSAGNYVITG